MKIKIKEGFLLRKVAGDHVVVPVGEAGKVFHGMIRLNDTGAFLWEQCRKETTKEQVLQTVCRMGSKSGDENTKPGKQKMSRRGTIMSWNRRMPTPESLLHFQR